MIAQLREQFLVFWKSLSRLQRLVIVSLVISGIVLVPMFISWANTPSFSIAFSGLSETDAGKIVESLTTANIPYELQSVGTILVPSDQVYDVRLRMAIEGLPQASTVGFEIFSGTTLGMTEFTQRVNYQRALEGELERTISSLSSVDAVSVHIVTPEKSLLANDQEPATASITIKENPADPLGASQVRAITHLVASSVEGLQSQHVVIVDLEGNLLASGADDSDISAASTHADNRRAAEASVARDLEVSVKGLLDSVLGPNRSVVEASVTLDWIERETTTQSFDPVATAVRSSQSITEDYTTDGGTTGGVPGAEPNLPPEEIEETVSGTGATEYHRTEEITNYEITESQSLEIVVPGEVERISLSVLVDGVTDEDQLDTLESAIAAAAGIDTSRGDVLAVDTLEFDRSYYESQVAEIDDSQKTDLYLKIGQAVAAALVLGALLWYIQRLLSNLRLSSSEAWTPILQPASQAALGLEETAGQLPQEVSETGQAQLPEATQSSPISVPAPDEKGMKQMVDHLVEEKPSSVAEIIHLWLREDEEQNG